MTIPPSVLPSTGGPMVLPTLYHVVTSGGCRWSASVTTDKIILSWAHSWTRNVMSERTLLNIRFQDHIILSISSGSYFLSPWASSGIHFLSCKDTAQKAILLHFLDHFLKNQVMERRGWHNWLWLWWGWIWVKGENPWKIIKNIQIAMKKRLPLRYQWPRSLFFMLPLLYKPF